MVTYFASVVISQKVWVTYKIALIIITIWKEEHNMCCMSCPWGTYTVTYWSISLLLGRGKKMLTNSAVLGSAPPLSAKMMWCYFLPEEWIMEFVFLTDLALFLSHTFCFLPAFSSFLTPLPPSLLFVFVCILFWGGLLAIKCNSYIFPAS